MTVMMMMKVLQQMSVRVDEPTVFASMSSKENTQEPVPNDETGSVCDETQDQTEEVGALEDFAVSTEHLSSSEHFLHPTVLSFSQNAPLLRTLRTFLDP